MANKLIATVSPGKTFAADEMVDNDKLNQLGLPVVDMIGSLVTPETFEPGPYAYVAAGGTGDALTAALNPPLTALATGTVINVLATAANTGPATIDVNGLGAKAITKWGSVPLAAGDIVSGQMLSLAYDGVRWQLQNPALLPTPVASARGLVAQNNAGTPNSKVDIAAEQIILQNATGNSAMLSNVAVTVDMAVNGAGGLDTGAEAANTWYYLWLIWDGTNIKGLLSLSATAPTLPAGPPAYTYKALVGAVRNDGGSNFIKFYQTGRMVYLAEQTAITAVAAAGASTYEALALTAQVPAIAKEVFGNAGTTTAVASQMIIAGDGNGVGACVIAIAASGVNTDGFGSAGRYRVPLIVPQQIQWQSVDTAAHNKITVTGYAF